MNTKMILTATMLSVFLFGTMGAASTAFAVYMGNVGSGGETGSHTLEEALAIQQSRIELVNSNPASGSGTPYLDAGGVVGASIIAGAIFGGIAGAFFLKSRSGKYAAMGRG